MPQNRTSKAPLVGIYSSATRHKKKAEHLSSSLSLPITQSREAYDFILSYSKDRLNLTMPGNSSIKGQVFVEFVKGSAGYRRKHGKKEMLLKAIGFFKEKHLNVLDATGGMGKDTFLMATYGCTVHIFEKNKIVAALLLDGLQRAATFPGTMDIAARVQLSCQDSMEFLQNQSGLKEYDVIYLDPMFPQRSKTALVKKEMQMLQELVSHDENSEKLLAVALKAAGKRVVVKRPKNAPSLSKQIPSHSISGKTTRFDVYMVI